MKIPNSFMQWLLRDTGGMSSAKYQTVLADWFRIMVKRVAFFYQEFKRRLGISIETSMQFDLQTLMQPCSTLDNLCLPFSKEEIDAVILDLPRDKAPGPRWL